MFQKGVWHHLPIAHLHWIWWWVCQGQTVIKMVKGLALCNRGGFWPSFITELLLGKCSQGKMHLTPSSKHLCSPSFHIQAHSFPAPTSTVLSLPFTHPPCFPPSVLSLSQYLRCLLKCAVQQEKAKIILLPAKQDGVQKAKVNCSVWFLKLL